MTLTRDIYDMGRLIPAGTRLSDVYEMPGEAGGHFTAFAHIWGQRIKLRLIKSDFTHPETAN